MHILSFHGCLTVLTISCFLYFNSNQVKMPQKAPTNEELKAGLQFQQCDQIPGEPLYDTICHLEIQTIHMQQL